MRPRIYHLKWENWRTHRLSRTSGRERQQQWPQSMFTPVSLRVLWNHVKAIGVTRNIFLHSTLVTSITMIMAIKRKQSLRLFPRDAQDINLPNDLVTRVAHRVNGASKVHRMNHLFQYLKVPGSRCSFTHPVSMTCSSQHEIHRPFSLTESSAVN